MSKSAILIVDDEKDNLEALRRLLRGHYEVTVTSSPFEALKLVQTTEFNVIVSDQRMPEMTGVEFLEKVKNVCPSTTRILLTGYTDIDSVIGAINRGNIYRYVAKPWDPEELKLTLKQADEAFLLKRELEKKNEELMRSNKELQEALDELRILDRAKARFLSLVSHELNTPLTVITTFLSLLSEKKSTLGKDLEKSVTSIEGASRRLQEIVSEVITYVRLESDGVWESKPFDLHGEAIFLKPKLEKEFERKQLSLIIRSDGATSVKCDPEKMRLALMKVLQDAFARSPEKKEINVDIRAKGKSVSFSVIREGEAISEDAFKPLETAAEPLHHQRNLGLNLAICKFIVEKHRGEILLQPSPKLFTITLMLHEPSRQ